MTFTDISYRNVQRHASQHSLARYISLTAQEVIMNDDSATVQREFRALAEKGNFEAQYFLELYNFAQDVQEDAAEAWKWVCLEG